MSSEIAREYPKYRCHKEVWALKIKHVAIDNDANYSIVPVEEGYLPIRVTKEFIHKHNPNSSGYFVIYKDGYQSFSPAEAFEDGYTLIK